MKLNKAITLARKHLGKGHLKASSRLCLSNAIELRRLGQLESAYVCAMRSLEYSVGIFHYDYKEAFNG